MSDEDTTIADLKDSIAEFCAERDWDQFHNSKDLAIGIVTEASELLERFRFKTPEQIDELMSGPGREGVVEELCDTMYFILRFAQMNGIDLSESMKAKLAKNAEKYPVSLAKGCNKKYDEYRGRPLATRVLMILPTWRAARAGTCGSRWERSRRPPPRRSSSHLSCISCDMPWRRISRRCRPPS